MVFYKIIQCLSIAELWAGTLLFRHKYTVFYSFFYIFYLTSSQALPWSCFTSQAHKHSHDHALPHKLTSTPMIMHYLTSSQALPWSSWFSYSRKHLLWANIGRRKIWESEKQLEIAIDRNLRFDKYILSPCKKADRKLSVLVRICKFMTI